MRTITQQKARKINEMIRDAEKRGRYVYYKQRDGSGGRIYKASARDGILKIQYLSGEDQGVWSVVGTDHHIYEQ